ncbi:DUF6571 family protein, partial [Streptomyces sp. TR06-5]|uniref:DUF6571 family protein n=1 Tax=Streptomyces sp. TR06-5 TaxID=3385976 RepID=UPI00399F372B
SYTSSGGAATTHHFNGYQLTSSLLAHGDWDDDLLKDFGTELVQKEQDRYQFWGTDRESSWDGDGTWDLINSDPMVGFSDGLGHNPEAATDFLSGSTETDDGTIDNLDYLLKDREWHGGDADKAHFGHALEAATTGHAYDEDPLNPAPPHSQEQAAIMKRVVTVVHEDSDVVATGMSGSLGRMSGEYMADFNRAIYGDEAKELASKVAPAYGASLGLGKDVSVDFLYEVSKDPEGNAAVTLGSRQYSASAMVYHAENPEAYDLNAKDKMNEIAHNAGYIEGIAANAKSDEIVRRGLEDDEQYNKSLERCGKWAEALISVGGTAAGGAAGGPPGAAIGSAVSSEAAKIAIGELIDSAKQDTTGETSTEAGGVYSQAEGRTHSQIWAAMKGAKVDVPEGITRDAWLTAIHHGVAAGYDGAQSDVDKYVTNKPEE